MGRFLTGLSWSQPVASKAHALGIGLGGRGFSIPTDPQH